MQDFLDVSGIISFDEFVQSFKNGRISNQIESVKSELYSDDTFNNLKPEIEI